MTTAKATIIDEIETIEQEKNDKMLELTMLTKEVNEIKTKEEQVKNELKNITARINECKEKILLNAIVHGADFSIRHGMSAPYTHSYYITYLPDRKYLSDYCENVTGNASDWWNEMPKKLREELDNKKGWTIDRYKEVEEKTKAIVKKLPKKYNPKEYEPSDTYLHGRHIANGYETDGFSNIVRGKCFGTYASYTTGTQCELARELIIMRGYCADYNFHNTYNPKLQSVNKEFWKIVKELYKMNHMDYKHIHSDDNLRKEEWAKANPTKCMPDNKYYQAD